MGGEGGREGSGGVDGGGFYPGGGGAERLYSCRGEGGGASSCLWIQTGTEGERDIGRGEGGLRWGG